MPEPARLALVLFPVGAAVGLVGSLVGVGGGFFVVPFLLLVPVIPGARFAKEAATAASLCIVLLNAVSGTIANARKRRIDYRTGILIAAGSLPGAWFGRAIIGKISSAAFATSFAILLLAVASYVAFVRLKDGQGLVRGRPREVVDSDGQVHRYGVEPWLAFAVASVVGVVSSLFGVGGGLLLVPFLVVVCGASTIVSTATSQFIFLFTAAAGIAVAGWNGHFTRPGLLVVLYMGAGVVLGAQAGVAIAKRVKAGMVRMMLAAILGAVAAMMFLNH